MSEHDHIGHSHSHSHGMDGGWQRWMHVPMLRVVLGAVGVAFIATIVGLI